MITKQMMIELDTLDEIVGMSLVTIASPSRLLPLLAGFLVFRLSDIMKQPKFVAELEKHPASLVCFMMI